MMAPTSGNPKVREKEPTSYPLEALMASGARGGSRALETGTASAGRARRGRIHKRRGGGTTPTPSQRLGHGQVGGNER